MLSDSPHELLVIRFFNGTGMVFTIAAMTIIANQTPQSRLGEVMGVYGVFIFSSQEDSLLKRGDELRWEGVASPHPRRPLPSSGGRCISKLESFSISHQLYIPNIGINDIPSGI